ncbi:hypothetical protein D3C81_803430 [compost metagenome]
MLRLGFLVILQPFLQLSLLADLQRGQQGEGRLQKPLQVHILSQQLRRFQAEREEFPNKYLVQCRPHRQLPMPLLRTPRVEVVLWGVRRAGHQPAVFRMYRHIVKEEPGCFAQHRIRLIRKKIAIQSISVMLNHLHGQP